MTSLMARWSSVAVAITGFMQSARNWQVSICVSVVTYSNRCDVQYLLEVDRLTNMSWLALSLSEDLSRSWSSIISVPSPFSPLGHQSIDNTLGALVSKCLCCWTGAATGAFLTCFNCFSDDMYELLSKLPESVAYTCTKCAERYPAEWRMALETQLQGCVHHVLTALLNSRTSSHLLRYRQVWRQYYWLFFVFS